MKYSVQGTRKFIYEFEINASSFKDVERKINAMSLEDLKELGEEQSTGWVGDTIEITQHQTEKFLGLIFKGEYGKFVTHRKLKNYK